MGNIKSLDSGLDLIREAQKHYELVQEFNFTPQLFDLDIIHEALRRYEKFWLPLVSLHPNENLVAPLDIELIWIVHLHNPSAYEKDCFNIYGKLIGHRIALPNERFDNKSTKAHWERQYPDESFELIPIARHQFTSKLSSNIEKALINDYRTFCRQVSLPHFRDEKFLASGVKSYFINAQYDKIINIAYPYDRGFIWKTHMLTPTAYHMDINQLTRILAKNHMPPLGPQINTQGAMFRGNVAPITANIDNLDLNISGDLSYVLCLSSFRIENFERDRFYRFVIKGKSFRNESEKDLIKFHTPSRGEILMKTFSKITNDNTFQFDTSQHASFRFSLAESMSPKAGNIASLETPIETVYSSDLNFPGSKRYRKSEQLNLPFNLQAVGNQGVTISGWVKLNCIDVKSSPMKLYFVRNVDAIVHYKHYGEVLAQPLVLAPYSMKLKEAPCTYFNLVIIDSNESSVLKCRILFSSLGDFASVELFDLNDNVIASSNTVGKEAIPNPKQVSDLEKCCVIRDGSDKIYIVRGTNCDCGILKLVEDNQGKPLSLMFLNLRISNPNWELLFHAGNYSNIISCKSKNISVDIHNVLMTVIPTNSDLSGSLSLAALIISIFCHVKFQ